MFRRLLDSFGSTAHAALEISSRGVCGVSIMRRRRPRVSAVGWEPLSEGVVRPTATDLNVLDRDALKLAVKGVLDRLGQPRRVALVVPDAAGKVSMLNLEALPRRRADIDQVLRWQIRKAVPFPVDVAQLAWTECGGPPANGHRLLVAVMRRDLVEEYESVCRDAGAHAGLVDLATFDVVNAVLIGHSRNGGGARGPSGAWLLVHVAPESTSLSIVRDGVPLFYRSRQGSGETEVVDAVHQSAMYFEDRLGGSKLDRIFAHVSGAPAEYDALWNAVEVRLGTTVEMVDPRLAVDFGSLDGERWPVADTTAPVGILLRG